MDDLQFRDQGPVVPRYTEGSEQESVFVRVVKKLSGGYIQTKQQAQLTLLVFAVIIFIVSLFFFFGGESGSVENTNWEDF
ncbi:MAG: hypothetical protein ABII97_00660 [Patescibacteria group bacterium]